MLLFNTKGKEISMNNTMMIEWLQQRLANGPMKLEAVRQEAEAHGFSWDSLSKAAMALKVRESMVYGTRERLWELSGAPAGGASATTSTAQDVVAATDRERARCVAILESDAGRKRPDLAIIHVKIGSQAAPAIAAMEVPTGSRDDGTPKPQADQAKIFDQYRGPAATKQTETAAEIYARRHAQAGHGKQPGTPGKGAKLDAGAIYSRLRGSSAAFRG
jgi:hypothetical protein